MSPDDARGKDPAFEDKLKKFRAVVKVGERMGEVAAHGLQIKKQQEMEVIKKKDRLRRIDEVNADDGVSNKNAKDKVAGGIMTSERAAT